MTMKQLSGLDASFLFLETPEMPMHVGALHILELPAGYKGRFVRDLLVLRLRVAPSDEQLAALNRDFGDLLLGGRIECCGALPEEEGEDAALPRLALLFNRRRVGLLRRLIDRANGWAAEAGSPRDASPRAITEGPLPPEAESAELEEEPERG